MTSNPAVQNVTAAVSQRIRRSSEPGHRNPGRRRRDTQGKSQNQMRQRCKSLGVGIEEHNRQRNRRQFQTERIQCPGGAARNTHIASRNKSPHKLGGSGMPPGKWRIRVRGLRPSMRRVQNAIERHGGRTGAHHRHHDPEHLPERERQPGVMHSRNASSAPVSAKGSAKTECSNLIISRLSWIRFQGMSRSWFRLPF